MGIGQEWRTEDSFGIYIIDLLKKNQSVLKYPCDVLASQGNLTQLIDILQNYDFILLIDAVESKRDLPFVFAPFEELLDKTWIEKKIGTHFFSLKEIYLTAKTLNLLNAQVTFLGVPLRDFGFGKISRSGFSDALTDQIQNLVLQWLEAQPWSSDG